MSLVFNCINSLNKLAKVCCLFFGCSGLILFLLFVITAKYYLPGDHIVQNGEALKHFET